jgi:hypothetical protein
MLKNLLKLLLLSFLSIMPKQEIFSQTVKNEKSVSDSLKIIYLEDFHKNIPHPKISTSERVNVYIRFYLSNDLDATILSVKSENESYRKYCEDMFRNIPKEELKKLKILKEIQ